MKLELSEVVGSFKKTKKGREKIMNVTEKIYNAGLDEGKIEGKLEGKLEGKIEGKLEGKIEALLALVKDGLLTLQQAAERMGMPLEKFEKEAKNLALL